MSDSALTLIICTYNRPGPIRKLIDSVSRQSRPPFQTLVIDGSPSDSSERSLEGASLAGLEYHRVPPEHRGLTRQRNFGIALATGNLISFLDDDTVPDLDYFEQVEQCLERHPEAGGVGGYLLERAWRKAPAGPPPGNVFRSGEWERDDDLRWRIRRALSLAGKGQPGLMPPEGHPRPITFLPPDGRDYLSDMLPGGAMTFRREVLEREKFSLFFQGYGLYEDLEYSIRASRVAPLYLCTQARVAHYHAPGGRPNSFRYGKMVVRNGWMVWRSRWPDPGTGAKLRWWAVTVLLALLRLIDFRNTGHTRGPVEAAGRLAGAFSLLNETPGGITV